MTSIIERAMKRLDFNVVIDPDQFIKMCDEDRELLIDSMSEKEKFENLNNLCNFKTLGDGFVGWVDDNDI